MPKKYVLKVTAEERAELDSVVRKGKAAGWKIQRAQAAAFVIGGLLLATALGLAIVGLIGVAVTGQFLHDNAAGGHMHRPSHDRPANLQDDVDLDQELYKDVSDPPRYLYAQSPRVPDGDGE